MNHATTIALGGWLTLAALPLTALSAQEPVPEQAYRDFTLVQRLRVVCEHEHFGRVLDLIADVPSGKLSSAVITMSTGAGSQVVTVPFALLRYEAQSNLLQVGPCLDEHEPYPLFDASKVKVTENKIDDGTIEYRGTILVSRLAKGPIALPEDSRACVQGVTIELASGHVAFCHVAAQQERAGDRELHPAPWSALKFVAVPTDGQRQPPMLSLPMSKAQLEATPSLLEVILQDALYRPRVYAAFRVAPPVFDRQ